MNARSLRLSLLVGIVVWVLALALLRSLSGPDRISEDDPRWDCATMGNQQCGDSVAA